MRCSLVRVEVSAQWNHVVSGIREEQTDAERLSCNRQDAQSILVVVVAKEDCHLGVDACQV